MLNWAPEEPVDKDLENIVRQFFLMLHPGLYTSVAIKGMLDDEPFQKAVPTGRQFTPQEVRTNLDELHYILEHSSFQRSTAHKRIIAHLGVMTLLSRTQFANTAGIKRYCLHRESNVTMYMDYVKQHLHECNSRLHGSIRMTIPEGTYQVEFTSIDGAGASETALAIPPDEMRVFLFDQLGHDRRIARKLARGIDVVVVTKNGFGLLEDQMSWSIIKRSALPASLTLVLLNPMRANADERPLIEHHMARLRAMAATATGRIAVTVLCHDGIPGHAEITLIGRNVLLVRQDDPRFMQFRLRDPLFKHFRDLVPSGVVLSRSEVPHV